MGRAHPARVISCRTPSGIQLLPGELRVHFAGAEDLAAKLFELYAGLFVCVDIAYNVFEHDVLARADTTRVSVGMRRMARRRSLSVLAGFTTAMLVALVSPRVSFVLICAALVLHLRPEARSFTNR